jgi:DNA-binding NarL/FixJ family response regulator
MTEISITQAELQIFSDLIRHVSESPFEPGMWEYTLDCVTKLISCDAGGIWYMNNTTGEKYQLATKDIPDDGHKAYCDYYCKIEPFLAETLEKNIRTWRPSDMAPRRSWQRLEFFRGFSEYGFNTWLNCTSVGEDGALFICRLLRTNPNREFSDKDVLILDLLEQHVPRVIGKANVFQQAMYSKRIVNELFEKAETPALVLNQHFEVEYLSALAKDLLSKESRSNPILKTIRDCTAELSEQADADMPTGVLETKCILDGRQYRLAMLAYYTEGIPSYNVKLYQSPTTPEIEIHERVSKVAEMHHLSRREVETAHMICRGFSNQEMADEMGVSVLTVKEHVKYTLDKLGVGSRSKAVAKLIGTWESQGL